jgi:hypothetical protein
MRKTVIERRPVTSVLATAAVASFLLLGLATTAAADDPDQDSAALTDETNSAMMQAGQQANDALEALMADRVKARTLNVTPLPTHVPLSEVPAALAQTITLSWNGSSDELASKIADAVGYKFIIAGKPPVRPAVVTMVMDNEPAIWALQDLGVRVRDTAKVSVNPNSHEIDYTYNLMQAGTAGGIGGAGGTNQ